jgi:HrpA-like RNA helicase
MKFLTLILILAAAAQAESFSLPSPDQILRVQEREARERAMAERVAPQPRPSVEAPRQLLSAAERLELRIALDRFLRQNPGVVIDARTGSAVTTTLAAR